MREYLEKMCYGVGLFGVYISDRGHGALSKNINSNPDLVTLKLKNKQTNKPPKNSNNSGTELSNSRFKHPKLQKISNSDSSWILHVHPQGQLLPQLQASGARRCPTAFHVQSPVFSVGSLPLDSVLCSLYISVVFVQIVTVRQLMSLSLSFNSIVRGGRGENI